MDDLIGRDDAIKDAESWVAVDEYEKRLQNDVIKWLKQLPSAQPEIIYCKDCKYWHSGSCEYPEHAVNCQDYRVGDIETEAEHFCGYAERREVTT